VSVYPFIEAEKAQQRSVKRACVLLEVSRAAYYTHRGGVPSARQHADDELTDHIRQAHQASKGRYGAPCPGSSADVVVGTGSYVGSRASRITPGHHLHPRA
jgi:hypothetical protein